MTLSCVPLYGAAAFAMSHASAEAGGAAIIAVAALIARALRVPKIHLLIIDPPNC
jgi:hypothetical protein